MKPLVQNEYGMLFQLITLLVLTGLVVVSKCIDDIDHDLEDISNRESSLGFGKRLTDGVEIYLVIRITFAIELQDIDHEVQKIHQRLI